MKFNARGKMKSRPSFTIDATAAPIAFETSATGAFEGMLGPFAAQIGAIPIRLAVPFMKKRRALPVIAAFGGFRIKVEPIHVRVERASLSLKGVAGTEGLEGKLDCRVDCKTKMDIQGTLNGRMGLSHLDFGAEDFRDEQFHEYEDEHKHEHDDEHKHEHDKD